MDGTRQRVKLWATAWAAPGAMMRVRVEVIAVTENDGESLVNREYLVREEAWREDLMRQLLEDLWKVDLPTFELEQPAGQ